MEFGSRFLKRPDLFPARLAGAPAGDAELQLAIAGGSYRIRGLAPPQEAALLDRYGPFVEASGSGAAAPTDLHLFAVADDEFTDVDLTGQLNDFDFDHAPQRVRMAGRQAMAQIRWDPRLTAALWMTDGGGSGFLERFENCFRVVVAYRLLELGGALVHSAAVARDGRAWLCWGHSGVGKSTFARRSLELGFEVLSDDLNAIVMHSDVAVGFRMPFAGELRGPHAGPTECRLVAIAALEQADRLDWSPLSPATAVARLLSCCPFVNCDPHRSDALVDNIERLLTRLQVGRLQMTLGDDFTDLLEELDRCSTNSPF